MAKTQSEQFGVVKIECHTVYSKSMAESFSSNLKGVFDVDIF